MKHSIWMRLALIVLSVSMVLSLAACKPAGNEETTGKETEQKTEATTAVDTEATTEDDGEETTEVPVETTTEKTVETTEKKPVVTTEKKPAVTTEKKEEPVVEADPLNVFVKADALANASVNSGRIEKGVLSSDGKYVTFANKADGADGWMLGYTGGSVVSGQYLVIKYRFPVSNQTKATTIEIFCSTANAGPTGGDNVQLPVIADGEWHIGIVDMAKSKGAEKFPANSDGTYTIKYARFDVLNGSHKVGDTVDVAYVGIDNSLADALALVKAEGMKSAYVNVGYTAYETYYASTGTTTPTVEDVLNVYVAPDKMTGASVNANRISGKELSADGKYITFTANGTGGDGYALLYSGGATVSGQYLVIKYRYAADNAFAQTYIEVFASCTNGGATGGDNYRIPAKADGEWHVAVVDFSKFNSKFVAAEDGTYTVKYARVDLLDANGTGEGDSVDIGYFAFTDDYSKIVAANGDVKVVDFRLGAEEIYSIYTSTGTTDPAITDVANKYFDAAYIAGKAPSGTNIGTVTLAEDGTYVSIYGKGKSDGFFTVFSGNTDVTGQYIVMKYRYVGAEGATFNPTGRPLFSGNVYAGPTGDDTTGSFPIVADGEWHMTVFNLATHLKDTVFVANEDGTYTVKYLRFDIADNLPEDCAFDIQYIALTDDNGLNNMIAVAKGEGLETVTARLDSTTGTQTYYTATGTTEPPVEETETGTGDETETESEAVVDPGEGNEDVVYDAPYFKFCVNSVNGDSKTNTGIYTNEMAYITKALETNNKGQLTVHGWFAGWGGVEKYQFTIDGGNTWYDISMSRTANLSKNPADGGIPEHILNSETALLNSGFEKNGFMNNIIIDLSDLVDRSVTVTVCAILTTGERIEFAQILNVFANCTHEANTAAWTPVEGDIQNETCVCTSCNKSIVRNVSVTSEGKLLFGADIIAAVMANAQFKEDENGLDFARLTASKDSGSDAWKGLLYSSSVDNAETNVAKFVGLLYRTNTTDKDYVEIFIDSTHYDAVGGGNVTRTYGSANNWHFEVLDYTDNTRFNGESMTALRLDWLNKARKAGDYVDLAFVGFFTSEEAAIEYYAEYVEAFLGAEQCDHLKTSGEWTNIEGEYKLQAECLLCGSDVVKDCPHETTTTVAIAGRGEDGKLYENLVCAVCSYKEKREMQYHNNFDAIFVGGVRVNPKTSGNTQQTQGCGGVDNGAIIYDARNKMIDKDGNTLIVTDSVGATGWIGVAGGINRYVYKINDGEWINVNGGYGEGGDITSHLKKNYPTFTNPEKNNAFRGPVVFSGLQAYANSEITITFAAVPQGNPGTAEDPNVLLIAVIENVFVTCTHENQSWSKTENAGEITCTCSICGETVTKMCEHKDQKLAATADPTVYSSVCNVCDTNLGNIEGINADGNTVYTPEVFSTIISVKDGADKGTLTASITNLTDPNYNNLPFTRIKMTSNATHGESYIYVKPGSAKVGKFVAVIYRTVNVKGDEMFITKPGAGFGSGMNINTPNPTVKLNSVGFEIAVFDFTSRNNWNETTGIGQIRWDMNNKLVKGAYLDVAALAFFDSKAAAEEFYDQFVEKYDLLDKPFRFLVNGDGLKVDGVAQNLDLTGKTNGAISSDILVQDFTGVVLNTPKSITISSWCATKNGTSAYKLIVSDGTTTETVHWANVSGDRTDIRDAVLKDFPGYGFTDQCGVGAAMPGTIDLTKFNGKTVDVQIVAEANGIGSIVIAAFNNISVPCTHTRNTAAWTLDVDNPQYETSDCTVCGQSVSRALVESPEGLIFFNHEYIKDKAGDVAKVMNDGPNGMSYVRFTAAKTSGEETVTLIAAKDASEIRTNVGEYVAVLYRTSLENRVEYVLDSEMSYARGGVQSLGTRKCADQWYFTVDKNDTHEKYDGKNVACFRFDQFDAVRTTSDYTDVAFIGCFSTAEAAWAFFEVYAEAYGLTAGENYMPCFRLGLDDGNNKVNGKTFLGNFTSTNDKACEVDLADKPLTNAASSLQFGGWCVTPGGIQSFGFYVVDPVTETKSEFVKVIDGGIASAAIKAEGTKLNYPGSCELGAITNSIQTINLTAFAGETAKTVDIYVVATLRWGGEIELIHYTNVVIPATPATAE